METVKDVLLAGGPEQVPLLENRNRSTAVTFTADLHKRLISNNITSLPQTNLSFTLIGRLLFVLCNPVDEHMRWNQHKDSPPVGGPVLTASPLPLPCPRTWLGPQSCQRRKVPSSAPHRLSVILFKMSVIDLYFDDRLSSCREISVGAGPGTV